MFIYIRSKSVWVVWLSLPQSTYLDLDNRFGNEFLILIIIIDFMNCHKYIM